MRKKALVSILVVVMTIVCLAGCSGKPGFETSSLVNASKQYGIAQAYNILDVTSLISVSTNVGTAYYVSKDQNDAQRVYDYYINTSGNLPKVVVNEAAVVAANEYFENGNNTTIVYQLNLKNSGEAKELYSAFADAFVSKDQFASDKKDGYNYTISFFDGQIIMHKRAVYVKGNSVLFIYGITAGASDETGFSNYIFKSLKVVDPIILN